jgi:hypothetical protein
MLSHKQISAYHGVGWVRWQGQHGLGRAVPRGEAESWPFFPSGALSRARLVTPVSRPPHNMLMRVLRGCAGAKALSSRGNPAQLSSYRIAHESRHCCSCLLVGPGRLKRPREVSSLRPLS